MKEKHERKWEKQRENRFEMKIGEESEGRISNEWKKIFGSRGFCGNRISVTTR